MSQRFTGWHALAIFVVCFGVVLAVNVFMMRAAFSTFGGLVVDNSYVASQDFNRWLGEAERSKELGWQARATLDRDRHVAVALDGAPKSAALKGEARHPLGALRDIALDFAVQSDGSFLSRQELPRGRWTLRLEARAGHDVWKSEQEVR